MALQVISEPTTFTGGLSANNFPISVGGDVVLLASATASSSTSITFDNIFDSAVYVEYQLRFLSLAPATDNVAFRLVLRDSSGSDMNSIYRWGQLGIRIDTTGAGNASNLNSTVGYAFLGTGNGNAVNERGSGRVTISPTTSWWTIFHAEMYGTGINGDRYVIRHTGAYEDTTTAPAGIRIFCSSGNIAIGQFYLYGIKK
jgi:hypothetical protein